MQRGVTGKSIDNKINTKILLNLRKYFRLNNNENATCPNVAEAKTMLRRKSTA